MLPLQVGGGPNSRSDMNMGTAGSLASASLISAQHTGLVEVITGDTPMAPCNMDIDISSEVEIFTDKFIGESRKLD